MIRGLFQNAVIIHNPRGGKVFSQAIFILRPEAACSEQDMMEEAQKIIADNTSVRKKRRIFR
ncbi:MAG: hypothetical protein IIY12_00600 [Clostridia bacterium]|nr:hypothetical protein [Clostridia bacterium]